MVESLNMSPCPSGDDLRDDGLAYAVTGGNLALRDRSGRAERTNLTNYVIRQLGATTLYAALVLAIHSEKSVVIPSPLSGHVGEVVGLRPEEQMTKVAAGRVVATMADLLRPRQFHAMGHLPQVSMCESCSVVADVDDAVAVLINASRPRMTSVGTSARIDPGNQTLEYGLLSAFGAHEARYPKALTGAV